MLGELTNHLWQSTLFAVAVALLTLAFRKHRAQVRYCLWLSASLKFFIPLALLTSLGRRIELWTRLLHRGAAPAAISAPGFRVEQIVRPFPETASFVVSSFKGAGGLLAAAIGVWTLGFVLIALIRLRGWRRIRAAARLSIPVGIPACRMPSGIEIRSSPFLLEPGVVGIGLRPGGKWLGSVLLLPSGIIGRLTPSQLQMVLEHEFCHVRRRDNLFASIHMVAEAIFWFHPPVWWIGARLVEERERACDEEVLRRRGNPRTYAEGILSVCKLCIESPLACVSGITSASLKRRIEAIMANRTARQLNRANKSLLASAAIAVLALSFFIGAGDVPGVRAQSPAVVSPRFEVASIKVSKNPEPGGNVDITPGRFRGKDLALQWLILVAYRIKSGNLSGELPSWTISERYDIDATTGSAASEDQILLALQLLLKDRFQLREHRETRQQPVYFLTIGKNGVKMPPGSCVPAKKDLPNECYSRKSEGLIDTLDWRGVSMSAPAGVAYRSLAWALTAPLGRPVIDKTGVAGTFDVHLRWARDPAPADLRPIDGSTTPPAETNPGAPSLAIAIQEQLGLKLEPGKGPVDYLIVDHVERPGAN